MNHVWFCRVAGGGLTVMLLVLGGCGEVDVPVQDPAPQLKLLNRYPHDGETDVSVDMVAIVSFSHQVTIGEQGTNAVNGDSFTLSKAGTGVSCEVEASELDEMHATALLTPGAPLDSGATYELCLSEQIRGTTDDGKPTEPLGEVMCTACDAGESCDLRVCEAYEDCAGAQKCNCIQFTVQ